MIHEVNDKNINSTKKKKFENQSLNAFFKDIYILISCQKITRRASTSDNTTLSYAIMQSSCAMITDYLYPILYDLYKKE